MAQSDAKRLLPILAKAFAEHGYRRATTAMLAKRCGVRENVIYRVWPSKKDMFIAAINYIWDDSISSWQEIIKNLKPDDPLGPARRILQYEAAHYGEAHLYRVVHVGLTETDDPDIAAAMRKMYQNFHDFIAQQLASVGPAGRKTADHDLIAWALVGLATVSSICLGLGLMTGRQRSQLFNQIGTLLVDAKNASP
jgi:AcrR family transcriptional regulator